MQFTLSTEPLNKDASPLTKGFVASDRTVDKFLYEYTYEVPAGTSEVTISFISSDTDSGYFIEAEEGTLTLQNILNTKKPETTIEKTTVKLENGMGSTKYILPYLPANTGFANMYTAGRGRAYQFRFVEASDAVQIKTDLPERVQYNQNYSANPLEVTVKAPEGSEIQYTWYQGATPETVTTVIDGENTNTYTPATDTAGVMYYRMVATVTETGKNPVTLMSKIAKIVVKDPSVTFSFGNWKITTSYKLEKHPSSDLIYTVKIPVANGGAGYYDSKNIYTFRGQLSGTIPDGVNIEKVWSGSSVDDFDLTKEGALTVDYDTNTFVLDLTKAVNPVVADMIKNNSEEY